MIAQALKGADARRRTERRWTHREEAGSAGDSRKERVRSGRAESSPQLGGEPRERSRGLAERQEWSRKPRSDMEPQL